MSTRRDIPVRKCIAFSLAGVVVIWLGLELAMFCCLRLDPEPAESEYSFLYQAHPYRAYVPVPGKTDREERMSYNSHGFRGPEFGIAKSSDTIRIVCLGGSTTVGEGATTDSHTFPARMEGLLRKHYRDAPFRIDVLNGGVTASVSLESLIHFETRVNELSPDIVIFHHVLNDMWLMVRLPGFVSDYSNARSPFRLPPTKLWEYSPMLAVLFARQSCNSPYFGTRNATLPDMILTRPQVSRNSRRGSWNELDAAMVEAFRRNVLSFVSVARGNEVVPVLATEVSRPGETEGDLIGLMFDSAEMLNQVKREIAARESVGLIDFARAMTWNRDDFYDGCHLVDTPGGLTRKAEIFARALIDDKVVERVYERRGQGESGGGG